METDISLRKVMRVSGQASQRCFNNGLMIMAFGILAGMEYRGDQFSPEVFKEKPRPVAVVVMVVKGKLP